MKKTRQLPETESESTQAHVKQLIAQEGAEGWELAKKTIRSHETSSQGLRDALNHLAECHPDFFRPALVSLCCRAVGGDSKVTVPTSAALVLLAKAVGIHDDLIDDSKTRNKRPTLFGMYGKDVALIAGDVLVFKGFTLLRRNVELGVSVGSVSRILETIDRVWREQGESEAMEVESKGRTDMTPEECLTKIRMRSSEIEANARIGGILGDGSDGEIKALGEYGRLLSVGSILRDELIDMLEPETLRHRIRRESLPLPMVYAMQKPSMKSRMLSIISKKKMEKRDLLRISRMVGDAGGLDYVAGLISDSVEKACSVLDGLETKNSELRLLALSLRLKRSEWEPILAT